MKVFSLPPETLHRPLPTLLHPDDAVLFAAETAAVLPAVETSVVSGEFLPAGWHADLGGWKGLVKNSFVRATTRSQRFVPSAGRTPLVVTDRFSNGYFHWVTEVLPRLWWLRDHLAAFEAVLPEFAHRFGYMTQSLALFPELKHQVLEPGVRWRLQGALLVPALAPTGNYRPAPMREVGEAWRTKVQPQAPFRKLYVSRSRAARRRIVNESELKAVLEAQGFETVYLEGMAFADQVRLLAETEHLISNHGAGLTNLLFMVPGTRVTEIRLRGDAHNNCYFSLARAVGVEYSYRLADPVQAAERAHTADLTVDVGRVL